MALKIGCCGWAVKGGMEAYFKQFPLIELQSTFYKPPSLLTARSWRERAPPSFEFTMKSWQAITHPPTSPTWRKAGLKIEPEKASLYGHLKPTQENFEAWERTLEVAKALRANILVIQLPPSMDASSENLGNMKKFLSSVDRGGLTLAVEFRHSSWQLDVVSKVCEELDLIHIVDPFKERTATSSRSPIYYRLHGLGRRMYVYDYSDEELERLWRSWVEPYVEEGRQVYVLFNNTAMGKNAKRMMELYAKQG
jgi:uncharacterized protein YecE (DUF72 family)